MIGGDPNCPWCPILLTDDEGVRGKLALEDLT